ncbi:beta-1,2-xylosyltransferase XYXT1-like [Musa acuminata AAA Group]|uniref:beta-1,2-xylosyltransferase XYXT1-like n=1 Tax=Musa acuminata AAA Group TaxID=214697 RepID=UPI0031DF3020
MAISSDKTRSKVSEQIGFRSKVEAIEQRVTQKMGYEMILIKSLKRMEARKLGLALLVGFCVGVVACFISMTVSTAKQQLSNLPYVVNASPVAESSNYSQRSGRGRGAEGSNPSSDGATRTNQTSSSTRDDALSGGQTKGSNLESEGDKKTEARQPSKNQKEEIMESKQPEGDKKTKASQPSKNQKEEVNESKQPDGPRISKSTKSLTKAACDLSNPRTDVCDMEGDVRIHGKSASVVLVTDGRPRKSGRTKSWRIKPYARKFDKAAMAHVHEVSVRVSNGLGGIPACSTNHSDPAIVFALGGYTGNYYHDFTDVLIPLFITSRRFDGEVQFVIETTNLWWISKYEQILRSLSRHEIIFFNNDDRVHCYRRVVVGLHSHKALSIDPTRAPNGYSMVDFTKLMRVAYSLERDSPIRPGGTGAKKPRLLLISRQGSRRFTNLGEIVRTAEELELEVVVTEAKMGSNVADIARVVNSCDVMMGVHGAGLTNFVFLPTNAVVIQIVPFGKLEDISRACFGYPSQDAGLHYLEYSVSEEESSLTELYPRDHAVFRDPKSIHRLGWIKMGEVYLDKQNVKLDVDRFRPLLLKARQLLHQ